MPSADSGMPVEAGEQVQAPPGACSRPCFCRRSTQLRIAPPGRLIQDGGIPQPDRVRLRAWAEVTDHFTITDRRVVDELSPYYVWTPDYAEKRLNWKRRHPLHILLLRVHRIPRPVTVRVREEYHGCRSWVEIDRELPFEGTPVMADEEFDRARQEIQSLCADAEPVLV